MIPESDRPLPPRCALLANVGSRDVTLDGSELRPARDAGARALAAFGEERSRLALPILEPTLRYLQRAGASVERVVLFATDQPETVEPRHRQTDTLHFATIIRQLLESDRHFRGEIVVRLLRDRNPSLYDETYPFYRQVLRDRRIGDGVDRVYLLASGGTPAMNLGLLVAAVECFGDRCDPLYLREGAREPDPLNLGQQLRDATLRHLARSHLERYQFAAAGQVFAQMADRSFEEGLAEYAAARLNFDWSGAWTAANRLLSTTTGPDRHDVARLREEARMLEEESDSALLLGELYHKARLAYETGAYKELLVFLFALDEYALKEIIHQELGIDFGGDDVPDRQARLKQIAGRPALKAFLESQSVASGERLRYEVASRAALRAFLDFLVTAPGEDTGIAPERRAALAEARTIDERLNSPKLSQSRNQIVHGVGGASRALIEGAYNPPGTARRNLVEDLRTLARVAGGRTEAWTLDAVRDRLLERLRR